MNTAVYISGNTAWIVSGSGNKRRVKIKALVSDTMPECLPEERDARMSEWLDALWTSKKLPRRGVRLILDADKLQTKNIAVPIVNEKSIIKIVRNEFMISGELQDEDMLYDYAVLDEGNGKQGGLVLGAAAPRALVSGNFEIFKNAHIELQSADISLTSAIRAVSRIPELSGGSYIIGVISPHHLRQLLFINGGYLFSNTSILFEERGAAAAVEIARYISSMLQFNMAQKTDVEIRNAYLCGMGGAEDMALYESMSDYLGISVNTLPPAPSVFRLDNSIDTTDVDISDYLIAVGGLFD